MLEALIARERDPEILAEMALASMRAKRQILIQALTGQFTDHHAFLARTMLDRIDAVRATEARLSEEIARQLAPFRQQIELLITIPASVPAQRR
ncbi:hypothetical protein AB0N62_45295 [Streptomyces sp. NPDC093982]|uniref:hypothetical protein n=1 Tax=Streptomyces sp. NPDC093982 TaxID=3155077 RepID=UPI00342997A5